MKQYHSIIIALLMPLVATVPGQNPGHPGASAPPPQGEVGKWLADVEAEWQVDSKLEVGDVYEADLGKVKQQYQNSIEAARVKATAVGDKEGAVAWRNEQNLFIEANDVPAQDDAADLPAVKQLRESLRAQIAQIETDRTSRAKALHARFDQVLLQAQSLLTENQRAADALRVKARRAQLASLWLATPAKVPFEPKLAKVEAKEVEITPLAAGERLWSDRTESLRRIPAKFKGYQFTRTPAHALTLRFKVLSDGVVYLCCMSRWGTTAAPEVAKDFTTEEKLKTEGWVRVPRAEILGRGNDVIWLIFSRPCKAGEEFAYRTDKYAPPIVLVK